MINFKNDYSDIAHEKLIALLIQSQKEANIGYGEDTHTKNAMKRIQSQFDHEVHVSFMVGGTITNKTVISHLLKPYEAVISASTGHIELHETGAIEQTGHKIITIPSMDGKISATDVLNVLENHTDYHMVKPKLVYISNATETGLIYKKQELIELYGVCQSHDLILFIDGARLGVALSSVETDLTLNDISKYSDIFYIGGTKNGALIGEAIVTKHAKYHELLKYSIKQNGGLLSKGFLIAIQFEGLFTNDLFFEIARHANQSAQCLIKGLNELGVEFNSTPTNQQFLILTNDIVNTLSTSYQFEVWHDLNTKKMIRLVTTYRTTEKEIEHFLTNLKTLL
ncbi:MAG TPA: aminotransferase class I/II-fold pyridoxal phosphate-dependent enzyme [Acholeplasma sp.]|nr:aminotransferase class I/II-fold pyridoxal phosphate-dependent enzyme [Acholeplasma sp.]